jgi:hypothetical protein
LAGTPDQNGSRTEVKELFDVKPGGRRRSDRPRMRWLDDVEADWRTTGIKRWRLTAKYRKE